MINSYFHPSSGRNPELRLEDRTLYYLLTVLFSRGNCSLYQFPNERFEVFSRRIYATDNTIVKPVGVEGYLESFKTCMVLFAVLSAPSEAYTAQKTTNQLINGHMNKPLTQLQPHTGVEVFDST